MTILKFILMNYIKKGFFYQKRIPRYDDFDALYFIRVYKGRYFFNFSKTFMQQTRMPMSQAIIFPIHFYRGGREGGG